LYIKSGLPESFRFFLFLKFFFVVGLSVLVTNFFAFLREVVIVHRIKNYKFNIED